MPMHKLSSLYLLSTFGTFHVTKNTRLSTPAQLQCSRSGAWEPGNEARVQFLVIIVLVSCWDPTLSWSKTVWWKISWASTCFCGEYNPAVVKILAMHQLEIHRYSNLAISLVCITFWYTCNRPKEFDFIWLVNVISIHPYKRYLWIKVTLAN